ncbi:MAG: RNA-binding S4 domain-containing protein [Bacilli bacterium]|nr:RNA-binding S4 domain-containing protein [Bacilli bacterium]
MRLDLFLKQTTLIKRRTIAKELADKGKIFVNDKVAKPSTEVKTGDFLRLVLGSRIVSCEAVLELRGKREIASVINNKIEKNDQD